MADGKKGEQGTMNDALLDEELRRLRREFVRAFADEAGQDVVVSPGGEAAVWVDPAGHLCNATVTAYAGPTRGDEHLLPRIVVNLRGPDDAYRRLIEDAGGRITGDGSRPTLELTVKSEELVDFARWILRWARHHALGTRMGRTPHRCWWPSPARDTCAYGWTRAARDEMDSHRTQA